MAADPAAELDPLAPATPSAEAFFHPDGDALVPAEFATSPWGEVLHGRLIGGLTARETERARADDPDLACGRLTIDMFRSAAVAPVRVTSRTIRSGRRIVVLEVTIGQESGLIGQGRAVLLRRSEQPVPAPLLGTPPWDAPTPQDLGAPRPASAGRWTAPWNSWTATESPRGMWIQETHPLVTAEEPTPLTRLALAADLASPAANSSADGLHFINADYTVHLGREPDGEYIGIQPVAHISTNGVGAGHCIAHDLDGPVGFIATTALANSRAG